jgi:RNA polymerase sigma factor (sigma-70 family)
LARSLAGRVKTSATERDELEAAAYLALVEAARSFDPARNVNFATFARFRIGGALRDCQRFRLRAGWRGHRRHAPAFQRLGSRVENHGRVLGIQPPPPVGEELEARDAAESYLRRLPRIQAQTCRLIYLDDRSQDEAAALLGYSKSYISRVHRGALDWLGQEYGAAQARLDRIPEASSN